MSTDENTFRRVDWAGNQPQPSDDDDEYGMPLQPPRGPGLPDADLELLTLAARAIGAEIQAIEGEQWVALHFADGRVEHGWNPLRHSDDAFTLAVKLGMDLEIRVDHDQSMIHAMAHDGVDWRGAHERRGDDPAAATRRAITRAAAEIWRAKEQPLG